MNSVLDNLSPIVDRWAIEAGRYVDISHLNQGLLSTQGEESREIERGLITATTHFVQLKHRA